MQRGLEGRRIAVFAAPGAEAAIIRRELTAAGAVVHDLDRSTSEERQWHGGMYAGLVVVGGGGEEAHPRLVQLVREFVLSEKPVAAFNADADALEVEAEVLTVRGEGDELEFARRMVAEFAEGLEEHALDDMSDQSFPASDPPAVNPGTAGPLAPEGETRG